MVIDFIRWLGLQSMTATLLITLGVGQLMGTGLRLRGASLVGSSRWAGYLLSLTLIMAGYFVLPNTISVVWWVFLAVPLAIAILFTGGSYILPPPPIDALFGPKHSAHKSCSPVYIPDGAYKIPGLLLSPQDEVANGGAVCLIHGFGDSKNSFKWRLVRALLKKGLTVLTIDLPGHGDYQHRPLAYPDALSTIPNAVRFLHEQPGIQTVSLIGISLGGAMAISSLAHSETARKQVDSLVVIGTPTKIKYTSALYYREAWNTYCGAPSLSLLEETTIKQILENWHTGCYSINHNLDDLFDLLAPVDNIGKLKDLPILLVYSRRDSVASTDHAEALRQAAPQAELMPLRSASHVLLTLLPRVNKKIARWIVDQRD